MATNVSLFVSGSTLFVSGNLGAGANMVINVPLSVQAITSSVVVVSSSIIFQSGSTKWGDTNDDVHSFTGSIRVNGSISGTLTGSVFGSINGTEGLTGSLQRLISGQSYLAPGPHITITTASSGQVIIAGEGVADVSSSYIVVGLTGSLPNERALAAGPGIAFNDAGPGGLFTISSVVRESADVSASYVTIGITGSLPNERALSASFGLLLTDNGAGSTVSMRVNDNEVATLSGSTFRGSLYASGGLTGSLFLAAPGIPALIAGGGLQMLSQSNGSVLITNVSGTKATGSLAVPNNVKHVIVSGALAAVTMSLSDHPSVWQEHIFKCADGMCPTWNIIISASAGFRIDDSAGTEITSSYGTRGIVYAGNNLWSIFIQR